MATKKKSKAGKKTAVSVMVVAATAAAAAGTYFLYGSKKAVSNRKKVRGWTLKAKGEVLEKIENMKELSRDDYEKLVESVMVKYRKLRSISASEVKDLTKELKDHWRNIHETSLKKKSGSVKKRSTKKATRKSKKKNQ